MTSVCMMLKSHGPDLPYAMRMVDSFSANNAAGLALYIVVPEEDRASFAALARQDVTILDEREFAPYLRELHRDNELRLFEVVRYP